MGNLPNAELSPRIVNGVLKWYQGDTFDVQIELELKDQDGEDIIIGAEDTVKIVFFDRRKYIIKEFLFDSIIGNTVTLEFDTECTALFLAGAYTYDIYYAGAERTTIAKNNKVLVETNGDYAAVIPQGDIFTQLSERITAIEQKEASWDQKGTYSKPAGGIPEGDIANGAVTGSKIADGTVTGGKLASGAVSMSYTATLDTSWTGAAAPYTKEITVSGILASDAPIVDLVPSDTFSTAEAQEEAWANVYKVTAAANKLTFYAKEKPTAALPVKILCIRK